MGMAKDQNMDYDEGMKILGDGNSSKKLKGKKKSLDDVELANEDTADHDLSTDTGNEHLGNLGPSDSDLIDGSNFN